MEPERPLPCSQDPCHWFICQGRLTWSMPTHLISWSSILISSHLHLGLPSCLFPSGQSPVCISLLPIHTTCCAHLISVTWLPESCWLSIDYDVHHCVIFCCPSLLLTLSYNKPHKRHAHNLCCHFTSISSAAMLPHTQCSDTDSVLPHSTAHVSVFTFTVSPWLNKPDDHSLAVSWLWQSLVSHHRPSGSIPVQSMWGCVVDKMTVHIFPPLLQICPVSIIPQVLYTCGGHRGLAHPCSQDSLLPIRHLLINTETESQVKRLLEKEVACGQ